VGPRGPASTPPLVDELALVLELVVPALVDDELLVPLPLLPLLDEALALATTPPVPPELLTAPELELEAPPEPKSGDDPDPQPNAAAAATSITPSNLRAGTAKLGGRMTAGRSNGHAVVRIRELEGIQPE
jgi:hypothetical protein